MGNFLDIISLSVPPLLSCFLSSPLDLQFPVVRIFDIVPLILEALLIYFLCSFFLCAFYWIVSIDLPSNSMTLSSIISVLLLNPSSAFFTSDTAFISSKISSF